MTVWKIHTYPVSRATSVPAIVHVYLTIVARKACKQQDRNIFNQSQVLFHVPLTGFITFTIFIKCLL